MRVVRNSRCTVLEEYDIVSDVVSEVGLIIAGRIDGNRSIEKGGRVDVE